MKRALTSLSLTLSLLVLLLTGCARGPIPKGTQVPAQYRAAVEQVLDEAGENTDELRTFLAWYRGDSRKLEAASFLVANLPLCDAVSMSAHQLSTHVDLAFLARSTMRWAAIIPDDIFMHYVLPHRSSQEPHEDFRAPFYKDIAPLVRNCKTISEAALVVNCWVLSRCTYVGTSRRDQGPLATIKRGVGRCEEEMILYISAARSVGIPARQCYAPWWQHGDSNHAWVEVWTEEGWKYLGGAEPSQKLNQAWFTGPAKRAPMVVSTAFGDVRTTGEEVLRRGRGFTLINSTANYAMPCWLTVSVIGGDGKPFPNAVVFASLYNYGSLRPLTRIETGKGGVGTIVMGRGTYLLTIREGDFSDFSFVTLSPAAPVKIELDMRRNSLAKTPLPGSVLFAFGAGPLEVAGEDAADPSPSIEFNREELERYRTTRFDGYKSQIAAYFKFDPAPPSSDKKKAGQPAAPSPWDVPLHKAVLNSGGNCGELLSALTLVPPVLRPWLEQYIVNMEDKDLLEVTAADMITDVTFAAAARERAAALGLVWDDETFVKFVLNNRIAWEHYTCWRPELQRRFGTFLDADVILTASRVNGYCALLDAVQGSSFGNPLTPLDIAQSLSVVKGLETLDRGVIAVAMLRSLGIPARYLTEWGWVEFHNGKEWLPMYPDAPESLGQRDAKAETSTVYAEPGTLELEFTLDGNILDDKAYVFGQHFNLGKFDERGLFTDVYPDGDFDANKKRFVLKVPPGEYLLISGRRNSIGEAQVRILPFEIHSNVETTLIVPTDLDEDLSLPVVRRPKVLPALSLSTLDGSTFDLAATLRTGRRVVLALPAPGNEPSIAMMPQISKLVAMYPEVEFIAVFSGDEAAAREFQRNYSPSIRVVPDASGEVAKGLEAGAPPAVIVIDVDGTIMMWTEGHNLQIADLLRRALK